MIKTQFQSGAFPKDEKANFVRDMPYPVRVGDEIEIDETGENWRVEQVVWVILENGTVELFVRLK